MFEVRRGRDEASEGAYDAEPRTEGSEKEKHGLRLIVVVKTWVGVGLVSS